MGLRLASAAICVSDIERSVAFYRDVCRMALAQDVREARDDARAQEWAAAYGCAGRRALVADLAIGVSLIQFPDLPASRLQADAWDFGNMHFALEVADLRAFYDDVRAGGGHFFAPPYEPQATAEQVGRVIFTNMSGPDGERLSLNQFPGKPLGEVHGHVVELNHGAVSVSDIDRSVTLYRDMLGLTLLAGPIDVESGEWDEVVGHKDARFRTCRYAEHLDVVEFTYPKGRPLGGSGHDAGTTRLGLVADDLPAVLAKARGHGLSVTDISPVAAVITGQDGERLLVRAQG